MTNLIYMSEFEYTQSATCKMSAGITPAFEKAAVLSTCSDSHLKGLNEKVPFSS